MSRLLCALLLTTSPALAEAPSVVTDLPLTQSLVAGILGEGAEVTALLERGADPHHAQLRPSQARALSGADLVVWIGPGLSPWLQGPLDSLAGGRVLDLSAVPGLYTQDFAEDEHDDHAHDDHDHDHAHDDHDHDHDDHGHDHSGMDPHLWLDPGNVAIWQRALGAELAAEDPEHAADYTARAEEAAFRTEALRAEVAAILAPVGDAGLVMFHDAYGYFAHAFGLNVVATISDGDASAPGAARIAALRADLQQDQAVCLFPEANHPDDFARVVAEGTNLRIGAPLDPAGMGLEPGADLYARLMRGLAQSIADCVTGG
ncbi:MAG: zinc ABC transporter substrate-binding protein [Proteobacteria bacterium]|nr:zinc ABC transporter substrate-binding protein [Pseudomonadota bacterium]